jgi:hypothetical protein
MKLAATKQPSKLTAYGNIEMPWTTRDSVADAFSE